MICVGSRKSLSFVANKNTVFWCYASVCSTLVKSSTVPWFLNNPSCKRSLRVPWRERERDTPAAHQSMYFDLHKNIEIYWDILYKIICLNISLLLLLLIYYAECHHCLPQEMGCFGSWGSKLATNKKTLSKFSIASITIEHGPFVDDLPRTYHVFFLMSIAVFNDQCPTPPLECLWARSTVFGRCSFCICWHSPLCWWQCPNWPHCTQYLKNLHILLTKNGGHIGFLPSYEKWRTTA